ncbi:MAG: hypothetical protein LBC72_03290 [Spirochaetaceae bacterium]|jgi:hypothetical protein|nr:hypothetical protein [Spirochaetaceae bacterium]
MSDMTEKEAWELDELLTNTVPEIDPNVQGPFIQRRDMLRRELERAAMAVPPLPVAQP